MRILATLAIFGAVLLQAVLLFGQQPAARPQSEESEYREATSAKSVNERIASLEQFLVRHPRTTRKEKVLEQLVGLYQDSNQISKSVATAELLLKENPENITALGLLTYTCRLMNSPGSSQAIDTWQKKCEEHARRGLIALAKMAKPADMSEGDFIEQQKKLGAIFRTTLGVMALSREDFLTAAENLQLAADYNPNDFSTVYPLALAYLKSNAQNCQKALWYIARASTLAPGPRYQKQLQDWGKEQYVKLHGSDADWTVLLTTATRSSVRPEGLAIPCQ